MRAIGDVKDGAVALHDPTVPTRPSGDASNAIATTGFVRRYFKGLQPPVLNETPPMTPCPGQFWWDTVDGQLYIWTGRQWVAASCCARGTGTEIPVGPTAPDSPQVGQMWFDTINNELKVWSGTAWMTAVPIVVPGGPNGAVQFNDAGAFGGSANVTMNPAGRLQLAADVVANLPAPSLGIAGARATVNDALARAGVVAGGGVNTIPVFCDGSQWLSDLGDGPAGPNNAVQFNSAGSFGGSANFIWNGIWASVVTGSGPVGGGLRTITSPTAAAASLNQVMNTAPLSAQFYYAESAAPPLAGGAGMRYEWNYNADRLAAISYGDPLDIGGNGGFQAFIINRRGSTLTIPDRLVVQLPAASASYRGARATVNDALSLTGIVQGGGANVIPVFCDGTQWVSDLGSPAGVHGMLQFNNNGVLDGAPYIGLRGSQLSGLAFMPVGTPWGTASPQLWIDGVTFPAGQLGLNFNIPVQQIHMWGGNVVLAGGSFCSFAFRDAASNIWTRIYSNNTEPIIRYAGPLTSNPSAAGFQLFTVATLPDPASHSAPKQWMIAFVSDALARNGIVAGGGANTIPVYSDGTNWRAFID